MQAGPFARRRDNGFGLIEMLVVVLILGLLAGIAIPIYLKQRDKAAAGHTKANLRNAVTLIMTARDEQRTTLGGVTGAGCSDCDCRVDLGGSMLPVAHADFTASDCGADWLNFVTKISAATGEPLGSVKRVFTDGWGYPIIGDENEGAYTVCGSPTYEHLASAGPDHLYRYGGGDDVAIGIQPSGYCILP